MTAGESSVAWTWRHAIIKSGLPATTRHVLLTVSMHMNELGEGCYPTVEMLVEETGLSKRAVLTHLQAAIDAGWLVRMELGLRGRKWRRCEYKTRWPERGAVVDHDRDDHDEGQEDREGGERASPPPGDDVVNDVHHVAEQGGERGSHEVVNDVHHYRRTLQETFQKEREGALARVDHSVLSRSAVPASSLFAGPSGKPDRPRGEDERSEDREANKHDDGLSSDGRSVLDMIAVYPLGRQYPRGQVEAAWNALSPDERQRAIDELPGWLDERAAAKLRPMFLQTYLGEKQFDLPRGFGPLAKPGKAGRAAKGAVVSGGSATFANYSREWFAHLIWRLERGESVGTMVRMARENRGGRWGCKVTELPPPSTLAGFVKMASDSEQWRAWRRWILGEAPGLGDVLPAVDHVMWLDLPSEWPPGHPEARGFTEAEAAGADHDTAEAVEH